MMGNIRYKNIFFKLDDPDGNYFNIKHEDIKNELFSGPSERYKKIKDLEYDNLIYKEGKMFKRNNLSLEDKVSLEYELQKEKY